MKIEKNKQYKTHKGLPVKIYEIYPEKGIESVHGAINIKGTWFSRTWR